MNGDDTDPTPPYDLDAERYLLAALIQSPLARTEILPILATDDFYRPHHELLANSIAKLEAEGTNPDPILLAEHLGSDLERVGGRAYLFELNSLPTITSNAYRHLQILQDLHRRRDVDVLANRLHQGAHQHGDLGKHLTDIAADLARLSTASDHHTPSLVMTGAAFILDTPHDIPCIWGTASGVAWAQGESLMIVGPPGVGKTTIVGQLIRARLGLDTALLGMPVVPGARRILYLAMDRPQQIARALARHFTEEDRALLADCMTVHRGPPPADFAKHPEMLLTMAQDHDADTVVIDSVKDAALGLSDDEVAGGYNRSRQLALTHGVELIEQHHNVKRGANGGPAKTLDDVYGSRWLTAGAGSVIGIWGEAGDPVVELRHLKPPSGEVGPFRIIHDHHAGRSSIYHPTDLLAIAALAGANGGLTAKAAASAIFGTKTPSAAETEKARRRLERLTKEGQLVQIQAGNRALNIAAAWGRAARPETFTVDLHGSSETVKGHEPAWPSRSPTNPQVTDPDPLHDTLHDHHEGDPSRSPPLLEGGERVDPQNGDETGTSEMCPTCFKFSCQGHRPPKENNA